MNRAISNGIKTTGGWACAEERGRWVGVAFQTRSWRGVGGTMKGTHDVCSASDFSKCLLCFGFFFPPLPYPPGSSIRTRQRGSEPRVPCKKKTKNIISIPQCFSQCARVPTLHSPPPKPTDSYSKKKNKTKKKTRRVFCGKFIHGLLDVLV